MATANSRRNPDARCDDLYTTPTWATRALLKREKFEGSILDAGCGLNDITSVLEAEGYQVHGVDLYDHGYGETGIDFLKYKKQFDNVISNPPFTFLTEFINKGCQISRRKVAIFARINALETKGRFLDIYKDNPPHRVYLFSNRVDCPKGGGEHGTGSAVMYCWIIWDLLADEGTRLLWIDDEAPKKPRKKKAEEPGMITGSGVEAPKGSIVYDFEIDLDLD